MNLNSEEEDDTFYYEVEKILNMQEGDNKENWFFIKWKNYDESWYVFEHDWLPYNTWEPEHNLNCPEILEDFLAKHKNNKRKLSKTKKKIQKKKPKLNDNNDADNNDDDDDDENTPLFNKIIPFPDNNNNNNNNSTAESSTQAANKEQQQKPVTEMGATKKKKVKKNKMLLNFIKEIRAEKMAHAPDSGGGNAPKKMDTDKRANKDKKKNVSAVEKPAANTKDNNVDSNEDSSKDSSKEKNKGKAKDDVTGKKKHEEKLDKSDKEKPSGDGVSKTSNKIGVPESSSSTTEKKLKKLILNVSPPKPPPTPPKPAKSFNIDEIEQMIKKTKSPRLPPIPKRPSQKSQAQAQNQAQKLASEIDPSRVTLHRTPQKTPTPITPPFHSNTSSDRESASPSPKTKIAESPTSRLANNGPQKQATTSPIPSPIYKQQPLPKPALSQQQLPAPAVPITPVQYQLPPSPMQTPQPRAPIQFNLNPANTFVKKGPPKAPATDDLFWKTGYPVSIPENRFQLGQNRVINPDTASSSTTRYPHVPSPTTIPTGGVKRLSPSKRDPRLEKRVRLDQPSFSWNGTLYNGDQSVCQINIQTLKNKFLVTQLNSFLESAKANNKNELRIASFLPLRRIEHVLKSRTLNLIEVNETNEVINMSRLVGFLRANDCGAVVQHPTLDREALVLIQADSKTRRILNITDHSITDHSITKLFGVYITNLRANPQLSNVEYIDEPEITNPTFYFTWNKAIDFFKMPKELTRMMDQNARFIIYGSSDLTGLLTLATKVANKHLPTTANSHVMMFDRYNETIFTRSLFKHKKEISTKIWEFGTDGLMTSSMIPATEAFPKLTAGLITTDPSNVLANPDIIITIVADVKKLNDSSILRQEWRFILPSSFIRDLKNAVTNSEEAGRAQDAMINISMCLSSGEIEILQRWAFDSQENEVIPTHQYIDKLARYYYNHRQFFVFIDDIGSVPRTIKDTQFSTDFIESSNLVHTFSNI